MKIGDKIEVTNTGWQYSGWIELAFSLGAVNWKKERFLEKGVKGYIVNLQSNVELVEQGERDIALIDIDGKEYLIGKRGIIVVSERLSEIDKEWEVLLDEL